MNAVPEGGAGEEHVYLLSRSPFSEYMEFMESWPVDAATLDRKATADAWRAADARMEKLRRAEAGWADKPAVLPLPSAMRELLPRVRADPVFQRAYSDAPFEFGVVELDKLVVSQKLVSVAHVRRLKERLGEEPSAEDLFAFCLPYEPPSAGHRAGRIADDAFAFSSPSNDLRFLEAVMLRPDQVVGYQAAGPVAGVVALVVGYGSNYLNVLAAEGRLVLNNGHHRACALRDLGVTHAPCVIQAVAGRDELERLAPRAVRRDPEFYLASRRPPLLKDYFDPQLGRVVRLGMSSKLVRLAYSVEETDMP